MDIFELIKEGQPVPQVEIDKEIVRFERIKASFVENGMLEHAQRAADSIAELKSYRPKKKKMRSCSDIQKDIDMSNEMVESYRLARSYELEADWKRNRDEFQAEFMAAVNGEIYEPQLKHGKTAIIRAQSIMDGFQECI